MKANAYFRCIAGCSGQYQLNEIIYRCPECGNLLEVHHEIEPLKEKSADEWKSLFDNRIGSFEKPYGSGVWNKKEWVLPGILNEHIVSMNEGVSHLFHSEKLNRLFNQKSVHVKLCGNSHTGSFKDLGMTVLVSQVQEMISQGKPIKAVACASTGDTSAALAAYASYADIPSVILLPHNKVSLAQLIQPVSNGAMVLSLDTDFDGCMRIVQELTSDTEIYLANSMNSLRIEGQKTVGIEVVQQLRWQVPDWFIIPGGNLGNVSALGNGLMMLKELGLIDRLPRIAVAQAAKANPLYNAYKAGFENFSPVTAGKTLASAIQIGNPVSVQKAIRTLQKFNGVVEQATEQELANASALADLSGLLADPHTGVALAALQNLQQKKVITPDQEVVVISTANGLKFADFKVQYHRNELQEVKPELINAPVELEASVDAVKREVDRLAKERQ